MKLTKLVRIEGVQVCMLGRKPVFFKQHCGVWEQYTAQSNGLIYGHPDEKPVVHFADDFLNSFKKSVSVRRLRFGVYSPRC